MLHPFSIVMVDAGRVWIQDERGVLRIAEIPPILAPDSLNLVFDFDGVLHNLRI